MLPMVDVVLTAVHVLVVVCVVLLWLPRRTRKFHLWLTGITAASWVGLGAIYGWGYCLITDWHWQVKRELGETDLPNSFVQYAAEAMGLTPDPATTDAIVIWAFVFTTIATIYLNARDWWGERHERAERTREQMRPIISR